jgi:hypothetical protein
MGFIILMIIVILLLTGIPVGLSYMIYRWIKTRKVHSYYRLFSLLPVLLCGYYIFSAIYPDDSFYEENFKEVTKLNFPKNGKIISKSASYPDQHGDYSSSFLVELNPQNINALKRQILNIGFVECHDECQIKERKTVESDLENKQILQKYCRQQNSTYFEVAFLSDQKSAVVTRASW